jgi:hypothetical protein
VSLDCLATTIAIAAGFEYGFPLNVARNGFTHAVVVRDFQYRLFLHFSSSLISFWLFIVFVGFRPNRRMVTVSSKVTSATKRNYFEKISQASNVLETVKKLLVIMFAQATCFVLMAVIIRMIGVTSLVNELALLGLGLVAGTIIGTKLAK